MTLKALMTADVASVFLNADEHAEAMEFHPAGGTPVTGILGIVQETEGVAIEAGQDERHRVIRGSVFFASADVTAVSAGDVMVFRSKRFIVESGENDGFGLWTVNYFKHETLDRVGQNRLTKTYAGDGP